MNKLSAKPETKLSSCEEVGGKYREAITMSYLRYVFSLDLGMSSGIELPSCENGIITSPVASSNSSQNAALIPEVVCSIASNPIESRYYLDPSDDSTSIRSISPTHVRSNPGIISRSRPISSQIGMNNVKCIAVPRIVNRSSHSVIASVSHPECSNQRKRDDVN